MQLKNCLFEHNRTGVHVYSGFGRIEDCRFSGNKVYGIKEDAGADPAVVNAVFSGNLYDYYDEEHTVSNNGQPAGSQGEEE